MVFILSSLALVLSTFCFTTAVAAFNDSYQCTSEVETSVGYSPRSDKVEYDAHQVRIPATVFLLDVKSGRPLLRAQEAVRLNKLLESKYVISMMETTSEGTVVIWTLFERDGTRPPALISTKSYDFSGAVSFTAFYKCK